MTNELAKEQMCILMRNGIEIWIDKEKALRFGEDWVGGLKAAVLIDGRYLNSVDITGVFTPQDLEDLKRAKQGQWKCDKGHWHGKGEDCRCGWESTRNNDTVYPEREYHGSIFGDKVKEMAKKKKM
jgi:hypothetical protein